MSELLSPEGRIRSLDSFAIWKAAKDEKKRIRDEVPQRLDTRSAADLRLQIAYLESEEAEGIARHGVALEIATLDDAVLPLPYRLGALAAFHVSKSPTIQPSVSGRRAPSGPYGFFGAPKRHEQGLTPQHKPEKLAEQVGDELVRIAALLDTDENVPVAMVWNHHFNSDRQDYDEVVLGKLPEPRKSFVMREPRLVENEDGPDVQFALPDSLNGVVKGRVVRAGEYVESEERYKHPIITTLVRLGVARRRIGLHDPHALYIGDAEVDARVERAERDILEYERLEKLRLDVRYPRRRRQFKL